jgi:DNA-binding CsgD family transcriptional regulator
MFDHPWWIYGDLHSKEIIIRWESTGKSPWEIANVAR